MMTKQIIPGNRKLFALFALVVFCLGSFTLNAGPEKIKKVKYDSAIIFKRDASPDQQKEYNKNEVWRYDRDKKDNATKAEETVFDRMWNGFWDKMAESFMHSDHSRGFNPWTILWILILAAIIILVILKLTDSGVSTLFSGKSRVSEKSDATLEDVNIHDIDYEKDIREALHKMDYRLAVRLWFLRTLKTLSDEELLKWTIDKTNSDYYYELSGSTFQKEFGEVTNVYDYIWYGEFPVDAGSYSIAEDKFKVLAGKIKK